MNNKDTKIIIIITAVVTVMLLNDYKAIYITLSLALHHVQYKTACLSTPSYLELNYNDYLLKIHWADNNRDIMQALGHRNTHNIKSL